MTTAIYPGSFDPVTLGHLDIIGRSAKMFDRVIVGVGANVGKKPMFTPEERVAMIEHLVQDYPNVTARSFDGLVVDLAQQEGASVIVRGLRAVTDFEYELQMSHTNHQICPEVDTIFLTASVEYSYVSSSAVKELAAFGGDISAFVPDYIARCIREHRVI